jgi:hypothetical protein
MTDRKLAELYRAANPAPPLDAEAEQALAAALLGGQPQQREAGLELLARLPQGPALARAIEAIGADAEQLAAELAARRAAPVRRRWHRLPAALAMAAGVAAVAVIIGSLGELRAPEPASAEQISAAEIDSARILVASFEANGNGDASTVTVEEKKIFRGAFDS